MKELNQTPELTWADDEPVETVLGDFCIDTLSEPTESSPAYEKPIPNESTEPVPPTESRPPIEKQAAPPEVEVPSSPEQSGETLQLTEADYKKLAEEIAKTGEIPEVLKLALQNGIGRNGIDLGKLNKLLEPFGMRLEIKAMKNGLRMDLTDLKSGEGLDSEVARTKAARESAEALRRAEDIGRKLQKLMQNAKPLPPREALRLPRTPLPPVFGD